MNSQQNNPERPPSYPYSPPRGPGLGPPQQPGHGQRPTSPLPPPVQTVGQVPPPATGYPPQPHQMYGQPPPYPPSNPPAPPNPRGTYYGPYRGGTGNQVAEVAGTGPSKAQLIVGIDFVRSHIDNPSHDNSAIANLRISKGTTFSGVAFAFATNKEAKEDIVTEWPGSGNQTKQKVQGLRVQRSCSMLTIPDPHRTLLRSISECRWVGPRHC